MVKSPAAANDPFPPPRTAICIEAPEQAPG
jgi:hypothetical protein